MPIYVYRCQACHHELEALRKMSDPPLTDCPTCGEATLKQQLTAPAFRLSGSGWYETDFKTDNKRNLAEGSTAAPAKAEAPVAAAADQTSVKTPAST